jgi:hypothetical protein
VAVDVPQSRHRACRVRHDGMKALMSLCVAIGKRNKTDQTWIEERCQEV